MVWDIVRYGTVCYGMNYALPWECNRVDSQVIILCDIVLYGIMVYYVMVWFDMNHVLPWDNNEADIQNRLTLSYLYPSIP